MQPRTSYMNPKTPDLRYHILCLLLLLPLVLLCSRRLRELLVLNGRNCLLLLNGHSRTLLLHNHGAQRLLWDRGLLMFGGWGDE